MSEVSDATQIVIMTARGGYMLGRISVSVAASVLKMLNTLYHAKWKGKTSFNRLRQIKGEDMIFINMSTENESELKHAEDELTAHGILFARLPDLCGGDGRTQYVISGMDAERFKAFLLDHGTGPHKNIIIGPVRPEDYLNTGRDAENKETKMTRDLKESARQDLTEQDDKIIRFSSDGRKREVTPDNYEEAVAGSYALLIHEKEMRYQTKGEMIIKRPLMESEHFNLYELPDGVRTVIIPVEDIRQPLINEATGEHIPGCFTIFQPQKYIIFDAISGKKETVKGDELISIMKMIPESIKKKESRTLIKDKEIITKTVEQLNKR